jgi:type 1 glutamine amidotransferase
MRILVLCDDYWHPAGVPREGLASLAGPDYTFDFIENAGDWSAERMAEYPVLLLIKSDNVSAKDQTPWMTDEAHAALADYVRGGHGLLAIHSGTVGGKDKAALRRLLGGTFDHHPEQCPVTVTPKAGHPLVAGVASFTQKDEHYFMSMEEGAVIDVFLTSTSQHGEQPAGWTRCEGQGRVCVLTPGHNVEVWKDASFQQLLRGALEWVTHKWVSHE